MGEWRDILIMLLVYVELNKTPLLLIIKAFLLGIK